MSKRKSLHNLEKPSKRNRSSKRNGSSKRHDASARPTDTVYVNFYKINLIQREIYEYSVKIEEPEKRTNNENNKNNDVTPKATVSNLIKKKVSKELKHCILNTFLTGYIQDDYAFDGEKIFYTPRSLNEELLDIEHELTIDQAKYQEIKNFNKLTKEERKYIIKISYTKKHQMQPEKLEKASIESIIRIINVVNNQALFKVAYIRLLNENKFYLSQAEDAVYHQRREETLFSIYNELFLSAKYCQEGFVLNADVMRGKVYKELNLVDFLYALFQRVNRDANCKNFNNFLTEKHREITDLIKGVYVVQTVTRNLHKGKSEKTLKRYKIDRLTSNSALNIIFEHEKTNYNVYQYHKTLKNIETNGNYPCVETMINTPNGSRKAIHIPIELCKIDAHNVLNRKINDFKILESDLIKLTSFSPHTRKDKIETTFKEFNSKSNIFGNFGITYNTHNLLALDCEKLLNVDIKPLNEQLDQEIYFYDIRIKRKDTEFFKNILNSIRLVEKNIQHIHEIKDIIQNHDRNHPVPIFLIDKDEQYKQVKYWGDLRNGLITQCVRAVGNRQIGKNLELKLKSKFGYSNFIKNASSIFNNRKVLIIGIDVTHPTRSEENKSTIKRSILAIVGSYDDEFEKYNTLLFQQKHDDNKESQEIIENLGGEVLTLIENYKNENKNEYPSHIIVYRDGVGEGQFDEVRYNEVTSILNVLQSLEGKPYVKLTYIIVQKRNQTRFFYKISEDNIAQGSYFESTITNAYYGFDGNTYKDFYLVSHKLNNNVTLKPIHYWILYDNSNESVKNFGNLTYRLCNLCARCTKPISIPIPVYYAHLAAYRGRDYEIAERIIRKPNKTEPETDLSQPSSSQRISRKENYESRGQSSKHSHHSRSPHHVDSKHRDKSKSREKENDRIERSKSRKKSKKRHSREKTKKDHSRSPNKRDKSKEQKSKRDVNTEIKATNLSTAANFEDVDETEPPVKLNGLVHQNLKNKLFFI